MEKFQCDAEKTESKIHEREKWSNKIEFVLSGISYAVGLGNIWRFPYLCYKNGGGAFLIPYFICILVGGFPIFLLEVGLGQLTSEGGITAWNICPAFRGVGLASTMINFNLNIYYIVILAWAMHYLYNSFTVSLPWNSCENYWNTKNCFTSTTNPSDNAFSNSSRVDSVVEYWERKVLNVSSGIHEPKEIQWELFLSLLVAWILVYFCVWKGIKTSGKVVYFTALFPYIILTCLFIRGITLDGAWDGIKFYLKPDFSRVLQPQVWIDAGTQIFYSYATALGCMIALGSYNKLNNNFVKDCFLIAATNSGTSLYAGFVIFSVLGFMAKERGISVADVVDSGPGLVFIAYPKAVTQMPLSSFWSSAFFFMIFLIGLASQFVAIEGFITAIVDVFPQFFRGKKNRKEIFVALVCLFSFVVGLSMITRGGIYVFQIFDFYAASGIVMLFICFCESICIAYFYGGKKFYDDIEKMVGFRLMSWFKYCWLYFTPITTMGILFFSLPTWLSLTYKKNYKYPIWALTIGWTMAGIPILTIPVYFIWYLFTRPQERLTEKWQEAVTSKIRSPWVKRNQEEKINLQD